MSDAVIQTIILAIPSTIAALAGLRAAKRSAITGEKVDQVRIEVAQVRVEFDGRMTELLAMTKAEGVQEGVKSEQDRLAQ